MSSIKVSNNQFQFILVLLKFLSSTDDLLERNDRYEITIESLKTFVLKRTIIPIDVKTNLLSNFEQIISSLRNDIFVLSNDSIFITKNQICSLIKPIITNAAINPIDRQKLSQFFKKFSCESKKEEFFLNLIDQ